MRRSTLAVAFVLCIVASSAVFADWGSGSSSSTSDGNRWFPWSQQNMPSAQPGLLRRTWDGITWGPKYVFNKTTTATSSALTKTRDALNPWKEEPAPQPWVPKPKKQARSWSLWPWPSQPEPQQPTDVSGWIGLERPQ